MAAVLAAAAVVVAVPWLSGGVDIYAHLLWTHQVMRCLVHGELPLWAPDLNAGFGSPGIRLYSPAGPVLSALSGLLFGGAGAGLRASLLVAVASILLISRRRTGGIGPGLLLLTGAPFLADLVVRAAWAQILALPLAWWLLEEAAGGEGWSRRPFQAGALTAALWLVHAPTAVMTALLVALAVLLRAGLRNAVFWDAQWVAVAAGLTAWHWLPLVDEMRLTSARHGLTAGIFDVTRNWLGSPSAHMPRLNIALSLAAVAMATLVAALMPRAEDRGRWPVRAILVTVALALSTVLVVPAVRLGLPLAWLQFPWRWLSPAALLLAGPLAASLRRRPVLLALWLAPLVALPWSAPVRDPGLTAKTQWPAVGRAVASFGGNPLAVDVIEHRPPWYPGLARELRRFGPVRRIVVDTGIRAEVLHWTPLRRKVEIQAKAPGTVRLRLLRYPGWGVTLDGRPAAALAEGAALAVHVPAGLHTLDVRWRGNPLAPAGLAVSLGLLLALLLRVGRGRDPAGRRRSSRGEPEDHDTIESGPVPPADSPPGPS